MEAPAGRKALRPLSFFLLTCAVCAFVVLAVVLVRAA